jgi:tRNA threonylcarbamoyladenosine biosynthesis protein TsaB
MSELLLAIDTATAWSGVALYDGALQLELNWRARRHHSEQLIPSIERSLELIGVDRGALGALAVSRGPGSYTGVRVGITVARMFAYALDIPLVGVDALDVLAYPHTDRGLPIRSFLDAGRRRYATVLHRPTRGVLERVGTLQSVSDDSMVGLVSEPTICCGELSDVARESLQSAAGDHAIFLSPAGSIRRAANLAEIAWQRWQSGDESASETDPIYLSEAQS